MRELSTDEQEIIWRARRLLGSDLAIDLSDVTVLGNIREIDDIGVAVGLGEEIKYAFFQTAAGEVTTSEPELIARALKLMRQLMVLDDLADV